MKNSVKSLLVILALFVLFAFNNCSQTTSPEANQTAISSQIFPDTVTEFKINVFYEVGAVPYTGTIPASLNDTWDITKNSYQALFQNHPARTVVTPATLGQMTQIPDQSKTSWTSDELISLGNSLSQPLVDNTRINVSVFFVNGNFEGNTSVLGVHFTGRRFAFVFKDIVLGAGGSFGSANQIYIEQATVVHELGHVVGLVNNGVPMVTPHEDPAHAKHTTNSQCVMYYAVESSTTVLSTISGLIGLNSLNLFGTESLADGRAYHP